MSITIKRSIIAVAIFAAFCAAGYFASSIEFLHNSIIASSAVFGVSFLSILGSAARVWQAIFG